MKAGPASSAAPPTRTKIRQERMRAFRFSICGLARSRRFSPNPTTLATHNKANRLERIRYTSRVLKRLVVLRAPLAAAPGTAPKALLPASVAESRTGPGIAPAAARRHLSAAHDGSYRSTP